MACKFSIPFTGQPLTVLDKAKTTVTSQGGTFTGDDAAGAFAVSVFGSDIKGSYTVAGQDLNIVIDTKPFLIPCSTIESFLKAQIGG